MQLLIYLKVILIEYLVYINMIFQTAQDKLNTIREKIKQMESKISHSNKIFQNEMDELDGLNNKMRMQIDQVADHVMRINRCSDEWEFANKLTTQICDITRHTTFDAFKRWSLIWPTVQLWLSADSPCLNSIYGNAYLEGVSNEISTQLERLDQLQVYSCQ